MPYKSVYVEAKQLEIEKQNFGPADPPQFGVDIARMANQLEAEGYAVIAVLPVMTGTRNWDQSIDRSWAYGFGKTRGAILLAKK